MNKKKYYTTEEELAAATVELLLKGQPMWAIAIDPKCPPDVAAKMLHLEKLYQRQLKEAIKRKGGR